MFNNPVNLSLLFKTYSMPGKEDKTGNFTFRPSNEDISKKLDELSKRFDRSKNNTLNHCIDLVYETIFSK